MTNVLTMKFNAGCAVMKLETEGAQDQFVDETNLSMTISQVVKQTWNCGHQCHSGKTRHDCHGPDETNLSTMKFYAGSAVKFKKCGGKNLNSVDHCRVTPSPHKINMATKFTPPKGRKPRNEVKKTNKPAGGWMLRSAMLQGGLEAIFITTSSFVEDAYTNPLIVALNNPEPDPHEPIRTIGLLGAYYMRVSLSDPGRLMNMRNGVPGEYQRKAFIRVIDEGEDDTETRLAALKVIKGFMDDPNNNKFATKVNIQEPGWDLTTSPLKKLDNYLEYKEIVKIVKDVYTDVDANWAAENLESALCHFTQGYIPFEAHADLGFPLEYTMNTFHVLPAIAPDASALARVEVPQEVPGMPLPPTNESEVAAASDHMMEPPTGSTTATRVVVLPSPVSAAAEATVNPMLAEVDESSMEPATIKDSRAKQPKKRKGSGS